MGTLTAFYVSSQPRTLPAIKEKFPGAGIEGNERFVGVRIPDEALVAPKNVLADLSLRLNADVIWLAFQSTVDAFQFHHWVSGKLVRSLIYGCFQEEQTWEFVQGIPEPWEREVFFSKDALVAALDNSDDESERREIERIWQDARLQIDQVWPMLDSRNCAHKIAAQFGFPHYGA